MRQIISFFGAQFSFTIQILSHFQYSIFRPENSPRVMPEAIIFTKSWLLDYNHETIHEWGKAIQFWQLPLGLKLQASVSCPPCYMTCTSLARRGTSPISMSNPWANVTKPNRRKAALKSSQITHTRYKKFIRRSTSPSRTIYACHQKNKTKEARTLRLQCWHSGVNKMAAKATTHMTHPFTMYSLLLSLKINVNLLNYLNIKTVTTEEAVF